MYLYHGTTTKNLDRIREDGFIKSGCWGTERVAEYYAEVTSEEDGGDPILLFVPFDDFDEELMRPDLNSISEPLTFTLGQKEDDIWEEWELSSQTWVDSLDIVESVLYLGTISFDKALTSPV